jgi:hypothetical protein
MKKFKKSDIKFFLKPFKGLTKKYMMDCIFNEDIQSKWYPQVGDIIVGCTGNVFVISGQDMLHEKLGGTRWYFGGSMCNRTGGNTLDETYCYTMNADGKFIGWTKDARLEEMDNLYHSSYKDFRFVPYPHEKNRM